MNVIDLTHFISPEMPVFPGTEGPILKEANTMEKDGFRETKITMYSHTGTHIDAPFHMMEKGLSLDDFPAEKFVGKGVLLDFSNFNCNYIELDMLKTHEDKIRDSEFIILKTGWEKLWGTEEYYGNFPALTEESANWLIKFNLKGIGIDAISIDKMDSEKFEIHKILMKKDIIIIENLTNLSSITGDDFILSILPLKNRNADGSPVRAIAMKF